MEVVEVSTEACNLPCKSCKSSTAVVEVPMETSIHLHGSGRGFYGRFNESTGRLRRRIGRLHGSAQAFVEVPIRLKPPTEVV